ncbi:MAG TPA: hypothetical protein VIK59_01880 [Verrucomicrobiae bacterium]
MLILAVLLRKVALFDPSQIHTISASHTIRNKTIMKKMFQHLNCLASAALLTIGLISSVSAQTVHWTAGGDQTSWTDANNWDSGVPLSVADIWIDPQLSTLQTVTLGARALHRPRPRGYYE